MRGHSFRYGNASKTCWCPVRLPGGARELACCSRRLAGNTPLRKRNHTGHPNLCVFKFICRTETHTHRCLRRVAADSTRVACSTRELPPDARREFNARILAVREKWTVRAFTSAATCSLLFSRVTIARGEDHRLHPVHPRPSAVEQFRPATGSAEAPARSSAAVHRSARA